MSAERQHVFKVQPEPFTDGITPDGQEMTKLPYPYFATEDGMIGRQDFWKGDPLRVIGFARDLHESAVDLWWGDAVKDPQSAVGMYLVTADSGGNWWTHDTAVGSVTRLCG